MVEDIVGGNESFPAEFIADVSTFGGSVSEVQKAASVVDPANDVFSLAYSSYLAAMASDLLLLTRLGIAVPVPVRTTKPCNM